MRGGGSFSDMSGGGGFVHVGLWKDGVQLWWVTVWS